MKSLAPHDRPREKLERVGATALGDNELLAIVLGHGVPRTDALELANRVLDACGGLSGLARTNVDELRPLPGIGAARAAQIVAALEAGRRTLLRGRRDPVRIINALDAAQVLVPQFGTKPVEHFGILLLDTKYRLLRTTVLSIGTLDASIVHPREVFREATLANAFALILFHNHPSGDAKPSPDDVALTKRMMAAGELMGITVLDHVIVTDRGYRSLRETGDLQEPVPPTP